MLAPLDWIVIAAWLALTLAAGVWFSRRASTSTEAFFVSDRSLPWWIVGTSMVATTFAADTPLVISGLAVKGLHANWFWWTFGFSGTMAVFLFARLWNRANVVTDAELVELRYGGVAGPVLRGAKAAWFGIFINLLVVSWVMRAMTKLVRVVGGLEGQTVAGLPADVAIVLVLFVVAVVYTGASGLYGVVATDLVQFTVAMIAAVYLAVVAWIHVGGRPGLIAGFETHGFDWSALTRIIPLPDGDPAGAFASFTVLVGVVWWTQANVDGGGYLAQRLMAARDDRHATWAYLWFTIAHVCLRPWPWVVVGLAGIAVIGPVADAETYYPRMMVLLLKPGLFGLMLASFLAAFMSTIDTQLNWGASVVINDLYRRFMAPGASEAHLVTASRVVIVGLALLGAMVSFAITEIEWAWKLAISVTAGLGTVYIARWYWWRVTAWCEMTAMASGAVCTVVFTGLAAMHPGEGTEGWAVLGAIPAEWLAFPFSAAATAVVGTIAWVAVAFVTAPDPDRPESVASIRAFYQRVRPGGPGWRRVAADLDGFDLDGPRWTTFLGVGSGVVVVYGVLIGVGALVVGQTALGVGALLAAAAAVVPAAAAVRREVGA